MRILLTGGASGLGEAITRRLARDVEHDLFFTWFRSEAAAASLAQEFPRCHPVRCDLRSADEVEELCASLETHEIDTLILNALPSFAVAHFHAHAPETARTGFLENVLPAVKLMQRAVAVFRRRKAGRVLLVLSAAMVGRPPLGYSVYAAEKAYLWALGKSVAAENAGFGIVCNAVSPGFMETPLNDSMDPRAVEAMAKSHPLRQLLRASETAEVVHFLLTATPQLNGVNIPVNAAAQML